MKIGEKPLISIVIPVFYCGDVLRKTLQGLLNADYPKEKLEIIFSYYLDPEDSLTFNIIEESKQKYADKFYNIKILRRREPGSSYARNSGIRNSSGDYIFILDDDIIIHKDTLNTP